MIIKVGFSSSRNLGELIKKFTGGDVNHAFIQYLDPILGLDVTFGANLNGFTMILLRDFNDDIVRYYIPKQLSILDGFRKNVDWINKPYDLAGLFGMSVVEVESHILKMKAINPFASERHVFCSEIVTRILRDSGYSILDGQKDCTIDPWMLDRAMFARPDLYERLEMKEE